ncbi:MAG: hypothetical protein U0L04_09920, partial [Bacteroidaceae bacterium]|nr:hypothetical protein [Bacteroidaceae bacterium]
MRGKPSSPLFSLCPWRRIFRASFLGVKIRRISLNNAFTPSFFSPSIYNNVSYFFLRFSFKKVACMFCHVVESAYLCTRKRETTQFA